MTNPSEILEGDKFAVLEAIADEGLHCVLGGGRYFHLTGDNDKGAATTHSKRTLQSRLRYC